MNWRNLLKEKIAEEIARISREDRIMLGKTSGIQAILDRINKTSKTSETNKTSKTPDGRKQKKKTEEKKNQKTYSKYPSVIKILNNHQPPYLTNLYFLNFLKGLGLSREERKQILLEVLTELFGEEIQEKDVEKALRTEETLGKFIEERKKKTKDLSKRANQAKITISFLRKLAKTEEFKSFKRETPQKLIKLFGRDIIPVLLKTFIRKEYLLEIAGDKNHSGEKQV